MHKIWISGILVFLSISALSQVSNEYLSLAAAIETALNKNPDINQLRSRTDQKSLEWKTQIGLPNPELVFAREGISAIDPVPFNEQRIEFQQEIRFPATTLYELKRINREKRALELQLESVKRDITVHVKRYYIDVIYAIYLTNLRKEEHRLATELFDAVQARKEGGVGTDMDCLASELNLAEAENNLNDADKIYHEARYTLFNFMGLLPSEQKYTITFADTLTTREDLIQQEEAMNTLNTQPMYRSLTEQVRASEENMKAKQSGFLPDLRLGLMAQDFGTGYHFRGFETGIRIPLWGAITQKGQIEMARLQKAETEWHQQAVLLDLKKRIEMAWHSYLNSKTILERYQSQMKDKATRLRLLSLEAYQLGQIDLLKLIEAQRLYLSSEKRYLDAVHDYYLRLAELEYFMDNELIY